MSTTWTNENLNDYLDDRLSPTERTELETIIRKDTVAIEALRELRRLRISLRKAPRFKLNNDFAARVVAGLKQGGDQPMAATIDEKSSIVSVASPPGLVPASSISASTWRTIAITMTTLAASLLLILFIRPDLSDGEIVAQGNAARSSDQVYLKNGQSDDSRNAAPGETGIADMLLPESNQVEPKNNFGTGTKDTVNSPSGNELPSESADAWTPVEADNNQSSNVATNSEGFPTPAIPSPESSFDPAYSQPEADAPGSESLVQDDLFPAESKNESTAAGGQNLEVASPFQFDELVLVSTTRFQMDTMIGVLKDDPADKKMVLKKPTPDSALHLRTQSNGLGGGDDLEASDVEEKVAVIPQIPDDTGNTTLVMSIEATPEQLDDFLTQIGAPASRIVEQLPKQTLTIDELLSSADTQSESPGGDVAVQEQSGAGGDMSRHGEIAENEGADKIAVTVLDAGVLSQKQPDMDRIPPAPVPSVKTESSLPPAVRRYLIVVKAEDPLPAEPGK